MPRPGESVPGEYPASREGAAVIDIIRDYTAIGLGTAQATTDRVVGAGRDGLSRVSGWGLADDDAPEASGAELLGTITRVPTLMVNRAHGELGRAVEWLGLASNAEVRALRQHVAGLERRVGDLRGER